MRHTTRVKQHQPKPFINYHTILQAATRKGAASGTLGMLMGSQVCIGLRLFFKPRIPKHLSPLNSVGGSCIDP